MSQANDVVAALFQHVGRTDVRDKPFVVLGDEALSYGALSDLIARTARLFQKSGVELGDRIVICSQHEIETIALYAAALRAGVTAAVIDPHSSVDEARILIAASEPKALFIDRGWGGAEGVAEELFRNGNTVLMDRAAPYTAGRWRGTLGGGVAVKTYPAMLDDYEPLASNAIVPAETSAYILFTSGTTSRPKGVEVTHYALKTHLDTMHRQYGYDT